MISVIVPIYNVEAYLDRCVKSICRQTYKDLEIILVNDGSPDNCPKMCDEYAQKDKRIKVIHKDNGGPVSAWRAGVECASGEYIGFVDSDDWIDEGMYEALVNNIMKYNADIAVCGYREMNGEKKLFESTNDDAVYRHGEDFENGLELIFGDVKLSVNRWTKLIRSELLLSVLDNVLNISMGEDLGVISLLFAKASIISVIGDVYYNYNYNAQSISKNPKNHWRDIVVLNCQLLSLVNDEFKARSGLYNWYIERAKVALIAAKKFSKDAKKEMIDILNNENLRNALDFCKNEKNSFINRAFRKGMLSKNIFILKLMISVFNFKRRLHI